MKWNAINIIGLALLGGIALRYYKQASYLTASVGGTAAQLYSVVSLQTPQGGSIQGTSG